MAFGWTYCHRMDCYRTSIGRSSIASAVYLVVKLKWSPLDQAVLHSLPAPLVYIPPSRRHPNRPLMRISATAPEVAAASCRGCACPGCMQVGCCCTLGLFPATSVPCRLEAPPTPPGSSSGEVAGPQVPSRHSGEVSLLPRRRRSWGFEQGCRRIDNTTALRGLRGTTSPPFALHLQLATSQRIREHGT